MTTTKTNEPKHRIYKYRLEPKQETTILLPSDATVLAARAQRDDIYVWVMLNPEALPISVPRVFRILPTGFVAFDPGGMKYISTVETQEGYIFHVFEVLP